MMKALIMAGTRLRLVGDGPRVLVTPRSAATEELRARLVPFAEEIMETLRIADLRAPEGAHLTDADAAELSLEPTGVAGCC